MLRDRAVFSTLLLLSSETLKCLVCKSLVEELEAAVAKVDPRKKIETGSFRLDGAGAQTKTLVRMM
jgi:hypothetical protein